VPDEDVKVHGGDDGGGDRDKLFLYHRYPNQTVNGASVFKRTQVRAPRASVGSARYTIGINVMSKVPSGRKFIHGACGYLIFSNETRGDGWNRLAD
jgi:hypothetical protein